MSLSDKENLNDEFMEERIKVIAYIVRAATRQEPFKYETVALASIKTKATIYTITAPKKKTLYRILYQAQKIPTIRYNFTSESLKLKIPHDISLSQVSTLIQPHTDDQRVIVKYEKQ